MTLIGDRALNKPRLYSANIIDDSDLASFAPCSQWVREGQTYAIEAPGAERLLLGRETLMPLRPGQFAWTVRNAIGHCAIRAVSGESVSPAMHVEVVAKRFASPAEQRAFVQRLLRSLDRFTQIYAEHSSTEWNLTRHSQLSSYALVSALLHHAETLTSALAAILADPILCWKITDQKVSLSTHGDSVLADDVASAAGDWQHSRARLPAALKGKLPKEAWGTDSTQHSNTPENQLIRHLLAKLIECSQSTVTRQALAQLSTKERQHCERALRLIEQGLQSSTLAICSRLKDESKARLMLQKHSAYQEVVRWMDHLGASLWSVHPQLHDAAQLRDAATLYEYWAFFALVDGLATVLDCKAEWVPSLSQGAIARFSNDFAVHYNKETSSYSGVVKPDFVLTHRGKPRWVFDAKMRVQPVGKSLDPSTEDLHKMHAYRDALGVCAAVCLYPGDQSIFWRTDASAITPFRLTTLLRNDLQGIGALAFCP